MPITQPTIDDFQDTTVMRVIRKVVNYLVTLIPKVNEEIASVTDNAGQRLDSVEDNIEALNRELPTEIRVDYDASTGNFNIDYVKEDGDVLTSNTVVIVSGTTGEVTIVQNTSGISINGTALQSATTAQPGLMTPALVASINNVNDTVNDHTTMINGQADAITELDSRVDALEQGGGGGSGAITFTKYRVNSTSTYVTCRQALLDFLTNTANIGKKLIIRPDNIITGCSYEGNTFHGCDLTLIDVDKSGESATFVKFAGHVVVSSYGQASGGNTTGAYIGINPYMTVDGVYFWLNYYFTSYTSTTVGSKLSASSVLIIEPKTSQFGSLTFWIQD